MEQPGPAGVHLTRTGDHVAEIDALAASHGGRVGLVAVLADLDRRLRRTLAPGLAVHRAWTWDAADRRDRRWWPQGISTYDDAGVPGRFLAVSWYATEGGCRVSFLDLATRRYRHALLAVPTRDGYAALRVHAGGIAWHGPYLHVAATGRGFWTCHADDVLRTPDGYVLPVRFGYRAHAGEGIDRLRYSFLSVDASASPALLLVGEYGGPRQTRRLARFAIDPATSLPALDPDGIARPEVVDGGVLRAQGAVVAHGRHYLTASRGPWKPGSIWVGHPGSWQERRYAVPMGPEDLAHEAARDLLWTVTEHPRRRWIVAVRRSRLG